MPRLSILIPTYNDTCVNLVKDLHGQCMSVQGLDFEILVADDGSTSSPCMTANREINSLPHCRYILREKNVGRAAIRNFLARSARYDKLLFIDSHMTVISDIFIQKYLKYSDDHPIVYGGYTIPDTVSPRPSNLRWKYETHSLHLQSTAARAANPYAHFHTSNFLISRSVMLSHPLDERFHRYGYEDELYGKSLHQACIPIVHIDNPMGFCTFESNDRFLAKTEEGIQTLYEFRDELYDNSQLLRLCRRLSKFHLDGVMSQFFRWSKGWMQKRLTGSHPSLTLYHLYRIGCLLSQMSQPGSLRSKSFKSY